MYGNSDLSPISDRNREATSVESQASYQRFLDFSSILSFAERYLGVIPSSTIINEIPYCSLNLICLS